MKTEQGETAEAFIKKIGDQVGFSIQPREEEKIIELIESRDRAKLLEGMRMMRDKISTLCQLGAMREGNDHAKLTLECVARMSSLLDPAAVLAEMEGEPR
jgi:hypothetical protein